MPSMIILKDVNEKNTHNENDRLKDIHLLIKEEDFPIEAVQQVQNKVKAFIKDHDSYTRSDLTEIAEDVIEDYFGTLIPFKLYLVSY